MKDTEILWYPKYSLLSLGKIMNCSNKCGTIFIKTFYSSILYQVQTREIVNKYDMVKFPENNQEVKSSWFILKYTNPWKITWFVQSHPANTCEFSNFYLLTFKSAPLLKTCVISDISLYFVLAFSFFHITILNLLSQKWSEYMILHLSFSSINIQLRESVHNSTYISILLFIIM